MSMIHLLSGQNMPLPMGVPLRLMFETEELSAGYELDSSAFVLNKEGKVRSDADFIFFNQPVFSSGVLQKQATKHQFIINPQLLPADIFKVVFSLTLYDGAEKNQNFSALKNCHGKVINESNNEHIAEFSLQTSGMSECALIFFGLYKQNKQWKLKALGKGFNGGLEPLARYFGVDIGESEQGNDTLIAVNESLALETNIQPLSTELPTVAKKNAAVIAQELYDVLKETNNLIPMAEAQKNKIKKILEVSEKIAKALKNINDNVIPLDLISDNEILAINLSIWQESSEGYIQPKTPEYNHLLENSKTLNTLHKNAVDILSLYKFSIQEIEISNGIGDFFSTNYKFFRSFKLLIIKNQSGIISLTTLVKEASETDRFLRNMKKFNLIGSYTIELFTWKAKEWVDSDIRTLRNIRSQNNKIRFNIDMKSTHSYKELITGHWFNAFAYSTVSDHLIRNELPHEIYTRVSYQSPMDIFKSRGDFDIIALVNKTVLMVECKSGNLKQGDEIDIIINKKEGLEKVFKMTKTDDYKYVFLIIYNPFADNDVIALDNLTVSGVQPIIPSEMRGTVFNIFNT